MTRSCLSRLFVLTWFQFALLGAGQVQPGAEAGAGNDRTMIVVNRHHGNETMIYAASELRKYISRMAGRDDAAVRAPKGEKPAGAIETISENLRSCPRSLESEGPIVHG